MKTLTLRETESSHIFAKQHGVGNAFARGPPCAVGKASATSWSGPGLILPGLRGDRSTGFLKFFEAFLPFV